MLSIKILGPGCAKCKQAEAVVRDVVASVGVDATIEKVEDIQAIMAYDVMQTPSLVVNGRVVVRGRVPTVDEVRDVMRSADVG